jgi:hypothetical protein
MWSTRCGASSPNRNSWSPSRRIPASIPARSAGITATTTSSRFMVRRCRRCGRAQRMHFAQNYAAKELRVLVDNAVLWDGRIGPDALAFDGR